MDESFTDNREIRQRPSNSQSPAMKHTPNGSVRPRHTLNHHNASFNHLEIETSSNESLKQRQTWNLDDSFEQSENSEISHMRGSNISGESKSQFNYYAQRVKIMKQMKNSQE